MGAVYGPLKSTMLRMLRAPTGPPEPPAGTHASVQVFRASPRFLTYRLVLFCVGAVAGAILDAALFVGPLLGGEPAWSLLVIPGTVLLLLILFLTYVGIRIDYDMRYYIVTDRSLRIREGAWTIREMTLTHANVQNLRVTQGPLQRLFGIWSLKVDTAGGGGASEKAQTTGHDFDMAGVENAHEVRDLVLGYLRARGGGTGLGDPDDPGGGQGPRKPALGAGPEVLAALRALREEASRLRAASEAIG